MSERDTKATPDRQRTDSQAAKRRPPGRAPAGERHPAARQPLAPLLRYVSAHPEATALRPLVARQVLALQASHGNQYVQRLVTWMRTTPVRRQRDLEHRQKGGTTCSRRTINGMRR